MTTYVTTFCNFAHDTKTGRPIAHECYILPPKALAAERSGDTPLACNLLAKARAGGKLRIVRGRKRPEGPTTEDERLGINRGFQAAWEASLPKGVFEVLVSLLAGWKRCKMAKILPNGSLEYELEDGSQGEVKPKKWRTVG